MNKITKDDIKYFYLDIGMSTRDIALEFNIGQSTVRRLMKKYNIPTRKSSERTEYYKNKMSPIYEKYKQEYSLNRTKICKQCNREYTITHKNKNTEYCSRECSSVSLKKNKVKQFCEICNKDISNDRNYKVRFCKQCLKIHRSVSQIKRIKINCSYCNNELFVTESRYKKNKYTYCNVNCMGLHYQELYTGKNSPTWKGGSHHYSGNWTLNRKKTRERDNYTCQRCGVHEKDNKSNREHDTHHIIPYKNFKNKKDAHNVDNLITLCNKCHTYVHSKRNTNNDFIIIQDIV